MSKLRTRSLLPLLLAAHAVVACECGRETFDVFPDAGPQVQPDAGPADAGPPPPEFPLNPGDEISYSFNVTKCNESFSTNCTEQSTQWNAIYTVEAAGAAINPATNTWDVPAEYFWSIIAQQRTEEAEFNTLPLLWVTGFGPWDQAPGARDTVVDVYRTDTPLLMGGDPTTVPFFDLSRFDQAAEQFRQFILSKDSAAAVETQLAGRKMEGGYLEPADRSQLHFVQLLFHPKGFLCGINESIGPWDPSKAKNDSGFANNQRDYKSALNGPVQLKRAGQTAGQFCKCNTAPFGNDCD